MLLLRRKTKKGFFDRKGFRNFSIYAVGELVLIVVGETD